MELFEAGFAIGAILAPCTALAPGVTNVGLVACAVLLAATLLALLLFILFTEVFVLSCGVLFSMVLFGLLVIGDFMVALVAALNCGIAVPLSVFVKFCTICSLAWAILSF